MFAIKIQRIIVVILTIIALGLVIGGMNGRYWFFTSDDQASDAHWGLDGVIIHHSDGRDDSRDWHDLGTTHMGDSTSCYKDAEGVAGGTAGLINVGLILVIIFLIFTILEIIGLYNRYLGRFMNKLGFIGKHFITIIILLGTLFVLIGLLYFSSSFPGTLSKIEEDWGTASTGVLGVSWYVVLGGNVLLFIVTGWSFTFNIMESKRPFGEISKPDYAQKQYGLIRCSKCGFENKADFKFCGDCGAELISEPKGYQEYPCKKCGRPLRYIDDYKRWYCETCGEYL
jgi:hypothetical protein